MFLIISQNEFSMTAFLSVSGYCEIIQVTNYLRLVFESLPLEKEKLLADKISKIVKYISLSVLLSFNVLKIVPMLMVSPSSRKNVKKKEKKTKKKFWSPKVMRAILANTYSSWGPRSVEGVCCVSSSRNFLSFRCKF